MNTKELLDAAMSLPPEDRAHLAHDLLSSLEDAPRAGLDAAWITEIEKRAHDLADGAVTPVDWSVARERITRRLHGQLR